MQRTPGLPKRLLQLLRQLLKYVIWFGLGLIIAGITAGIISGNWGAIPLGLIIAGAVLVGIWILFLGQMGDPNQPNFWQRRSTQVGTNAVVATIAMLAIVGLLNFVAVRAAQRTDLTENQFLSLAPATQQVLKDLKQPLKIYVFDKEVHPADRELLENLRRENANFTYEVVDPDSNPTLAEKFVIKNDQINRDVHIELPSKARRQLVQSITAPQAEARLAGQLPTQRLSESKVVNSIIQVTSDRKARVYFIQGHGERALDATEKGLEAASQALQDRNFESLPLNLAQTGMVPADANVVILAGPTQPLFAAEIKQLEDYLAKGGNLLVMVDPESKANLDGLLKPWGLVLDNRVAIDASGTGQLFGLGPATPIVQDYNNNSHPITKDFGQNITYYPFARPIEIQTLEGVQASPIALTSQASWAESDIKKQPVKQDPNDRPGPLPIAVALSRSVQPPAPSPSPSPSPTSSPSPSPSPTSSPSPTPSPSPSLNPNAPKRESRLVVFGNSTFAANSFFSQQLNGDMFLNSVGWLSQEEGQTLSIRPREMKNRRLTASLAETLLLIGFAAFLLPVLGFFTAGLVWWRRR
ncbi:MAG: Gldg family protein [Synechococcales bacterium]|nr:Gldg family protein [Synechococcales bacterium]